MCKGHATDVVTVGMKLEVEEQRCRAGDFIDKATTHAHGDIEVGRDVLRLHVGSHGTTIKEIGGTSRRTHSHERCTKADQCQALKTSTFVIDDGAWTWPIASSGSPA